MVPECRLISSSAAIARYGSVSKYQCTRKHFFCSGSTHWWSACGKHYLSADSRVQAIDVLRVFKLIWSFGGKISGRSIGNKRDQKKATDMSINFQAFNSKLKGTSITEAQFEEARQFYETNKCANLLKYLEAYNRRDCEPFFLACYYFSLVWYNDKIDMFKGDLIIGWEFIKKIWLLLLFQRVLLCLDLLNVNFSKRQRGLSEIHS